ncbi:hypothetical protein HMH01_11430 [Halovulum dunhuangense]|uniref:C-type lectin domain-containing protein n=1 Tax=Halovulum dunhuangense TaxID=1505036 RepID=A0A849L3Z2_9RHOB|nr:hypothetical protein [Halovulum dunhuangense]
MALLASSVAVSTIANAQMAPLSGSTYNFDRNESVGFQCVSKDADTITCYFSKRWVEPQLSNEDAEAERSDLLDQYSDPSELAIRSQAVCNEVAFIESAANNINTEKFEALHEDDAERILSAYRNFCNEPTQNAFAAVIDASLGIEQRTCRMQVGVWDREFKKVDEKTWVHSSYAVTTTNSCNMIKVERLETDIGGMLWSYVERVIPANPNSTTENGQLCSQTHPDSETIYTWDGNRLPINCDYVEFF